MNETSENSKTCASLPQRFVRPPCTECPFRHGSPMSYDADAIIALDEGYEPACHLVVGLSVIFEDWNPDDSKRCIGYECYMNGVNGFRKPNVAMSNHASET